MRAGRWSGRFELDLCLSEAFRCLRICGCRVDAGAGRRHGARDREDAPGGGGLTEDFFECTYTLAAGAARPAEGS